MVHYRSIEVYELETKMYYFIITFYLVAVIIYIIIYNGEYDKPRAISE